MRFSIRWLLAAMAYVAIAITAIATASDLLADLVWGISWLALCFAIVVACLGRRRQQAMAIGFVALAVANIVSLYLVPNRTPSMRLFSVAGYLVTSEGKIYEPDPARRGQVRNPPGIGATARTANAVGTLLIGLVGCFVGRFAFAYLSDRGQPREPAA
jgi:hypothetical protein